MICIFFRFHLRQKLKEKKEKTYFHKSSSFFFSRFSSSSISLVIKMNYFNFIKGFFDGDDAQ